MEACKIILGKTTLQNGEGLFVDLTTHDYEKRTWKKNRECPFCGNLNKLIPADTGYRIGAELVTDDFFWIDLRSPEEIAEFTINRPNLTCIPLAKFHISNLDMTQKYLLVCHRGHRSNQVARALREEGHSNFFSLEDGILGLPKTKG
jgi:rhodanese-related sulfurtransferase